MKTQKAQTQFKVGDKVKLRFPSEVFAEGTEINNMNCNVLFAREGFRDAGWDQEMNTLIEEGAKGTITAINPEVYGYFFEKADADHCDEGYYFPASCLELVEPAKKEEEEPKSTFKKGDKVVYLNGTYPIEVFRVMKDLDTNEILLELDDGYSHLAEMYSLYDPKAQRKKELEEKIKALEEELKNL